jgi:hypothetical protein
MANHAGVGRRVLHCAVDREYRILDPAELNREHNELKNGSAGRCSAILHGDSF